MSISHKRIKEIIKEEYIKLTEVSKEKIPAFGVAKKMLKSKWFGDNWAKAIIKKYGKRGVSHYDLEKDLPDYIEGKAIAALFEGKLSESKKMKYKKNDWKKINKIAKKKDVMIQTAYGDEFKWEDGSKYGVFGTESNGREIELDHDDIDIVIIEGRYKLSTHGELNIHSGGSIAQVYGKNAVLALDKKSMKELIDLIRQNLGLFEGPELFESKSFRLSNGVKVEFIGKMKMVLTNYKGKKVILDVRELRMFLKGAKRGMGVRA